MTSPLRKMSPYLLRSATKCIPCHSILTKTSGSDLYISLLKQFSSEVIHGSREWHMVPPAMAEDRSFDAFHRCNTSVEPEVIHGSREWRMVRPATTEERSFDAFHRCNTRIGIGRFVFNSRKAITEEVWRKSLRHATKKMDVMRLCLEDRGENLCLYEVQNHDINFKIVESKTSLEVAEDLKNEGLNQSFWSVRVVPADGVEVHPIPNLKIELPHQYNFLFRFHHGIMDGNTVAYIIRVYTEILDDILSGKTVNDDIKFGQFIYDDPLQTLTEKAQEVLECDPLRLEEERARILLSTMKQPIIYSAYPKPEEVKPTTHHIVKKVNNSYVNNLSKYCKLRKITLTAGFEAVFNTALVEMVQDKGIVNDGYEINIRQTINMRRYMQVDKDFKKFPLGGIYGGMQQGTYRNNVDRNHFWDYAKEIHTDFHSLLNNNGPIIENIVRPQVQGHLDPVVLAKGPPRDNSDYAFSNVLDLTPFIFYDGSQVQLTDCISYNFINNILYPILFQFSTYRGFGQLTCSYYTAKVADDTAHELMDRIMNVLDFVTK